MGDVDKEYEEWLKTRPECVQELARKFPMKTHWRFMAGDIMVFLLGYTESDSLIVSRINPSENFEKALEAKEYICASHLSGGYKIYNN